MFEIGQAENGTVFLKGRLDAAQREKAQEFLDGLDGSVTLDCNELEYISSAGLGVLLKTQKRLLSRDAKLRLVRVNNHIRDVFRYSGFDRIFEIEAAE